MKLFEKLKKNSWTVWNCFEMCFLENLNSLLSEREDKRGWKDINKVFKAD